MPKKMTKAERAELCTIEKKIEWLKRHLVKCWRRRAALRATQLTEQQNKTTTSSCN